MDMLMTSEVSVEAVARNFLAGNYSLDLDAFATVPAPAASKPGSPD
jgi:hypothetical protein